MSKGPHRVVIRATLQDFAGGDVTWEDWSSEEFEGDPFASDSPWMRAQNAVEEALRTPRAKDQGK